jgi:hypothetical protein
MRFPRAAAVLAGGILLTGCSASQVTLQSRPTDADSGHDLAALVADTAHCRDLEYLDDTENQWAFTCQSGDATYDIRVVSDESAKRALLRQLGARQPVKAGRYFLVQAALQADLQPSGDTDRFPGEIQKGAG